MDAVSDGVSLTQKISSYVSDYFTIGMVGLALFSITCMLVAGAAAGISAVTLAFLAGGMFFAYFKNSC